MSLLICTPTASETYFHALPIVTILLLGNRSAVESQLNQLIFVAVVPTTMLSSYRMHG